MKKRIIAVVLLFIIALAAFWPTWWQSALLLPNLLPNNHLHFLDAITSDPRVSHVAIPAASGTLEADLYVPEDTASIRGAFLLISGASAMGKDDPRIVHFGETLSRVGVAVLIPNFPDITAHRFATSSVPEIVSAYEYLERSFPEKKAGLAAFSIATGPMFMAAADHSIASNVDYLVSFGGYDDMKEVIRNAATGEGRDMTEAAEIRDIFLDRFGPDPKFAALLANSDPGKFEALYAALDPRVTNFIEGLSPRPFLPEVRASRILLLHSDPDPDVPTQESEKLASDLDGRAELILLKSFSHTDIELEKFTPKTLFSFYIPEVWKLYKVAYKILTF